MDRMTLGEQLHNAAITAEVAADARSTRYEFRALDKRVAQLESALVALIDAVDAKDATAIERALFVGRGLTF